MRTPRVTSTARGPSVGRPRSRGSRSLRRARLAGRGAAGAPAATAGPAGAAVPPATRRVSGAVWVRLTAPADGAKYANGRGGTWSVPLVSGTTTNSQVFDPVIPPGPTLRSLRVWGG